MRSSPKTPNVDPQRGRVGGHSRLLLEDSLRNACSEHFHEVVHNELCLDKLQPRFGDELLGAAVEAGEGSHRLAIARRRGRCGRT